MDGFLIINKPKEFTSFDVVAKLRGILKTRKIGHAGTLDPMATGVLPIFIGKATRAIDLIENHDKTYVAQMKFGITTDTLDTTGTVLATQQSDVTEPELREVLAGFVGEILQLPPMYSAVKVNGKKLYQLAREGKTVEREFRNVVIHRLELQGFNAGAQTAEILVSCSKGTYIRSLCEDVGKSLRVGAVLSELTRTEACGFTLGQAVTLAQVEAGEYSLQGIEELFTSLPRVTLTPQQAYMYGNGRRLNIEKIQNVQTVTNKTNSKLAVYGEGQFLGLATSRDGLLIHLKNFY